jgi:hypothetical protein
MELVRRGLAESDPKPTTAQQPQPRRLTVREAMRQLQRSPQPPQPPKAATEGRPSVVSAWFNPWAHQSGQQTWAGLTESIIEAVAPVLYPTEATRERYWFSRNLARVDRQAIRSTLRKRVISPLLGVALITIAVPVALTIAQLGQPLKVLGVPVNAVAIALLIPLAFLLTGVAHTVVRHRWGWAISYLPSEIFSGPISTQSDAVGIGADVGRAPTYVDPLRQAARGSLYLYQHDVNALLADIAATGHELVVFVDDLDRCRAATAAEVMEAINLFLSGLNSETLRARFVIGMDPAVIAAHLDQIYTELPNLSVALHGDDPSPGWAFLRKLVQLPVTVPRLQDWAVDDFIQAATSGPQPRHMPSQPDTTATSIASHRPRQLASVTSPTSPTIRLPHEVASARSSDPPPGQPVEVIAWRSMEQHPAVHQLLRERLAAQPERSIREAKRIINVWQFYQRVLDRTAPPPDLATAIKRARHLVVLAEIITRWPALQRHLRHQADGQSGLRLLAGAAHDDNLWRQAVLRLHIDERPPGSALVSLRNLLMTHEGSMVADLADLLL